MRNGFYLSKLESTLALTSDATDSSPAETYEYQAELVVQWISDLIVHSLYSNKEVYLKELISLFVELVTDGSRRCGGADYWQVMWWCLLMAAGWCCFRWYGDVVGGSLCWNGDKDFSKSHQRKKKISECRHPGMRRV